MKDWFQVALGWNVVKRALVCTAIVGPVLILINHGAAILRGELSLGRVSQMCLTLLVPYCVSTSSSVAAMRAAERVKSDLKRY
jgi:hypothetical protein